MIILRDVCLITFTSLDQSIGDNYLATIHAVLSIITKTLFINTGTVATPDKQKCDILFLFLFNRNDANFNFRAKTKG